MIIEFNNNSGNLLYNYTEFLANSEELGKFSIRRIFHTSTSERRKRVKQQ